MRSLGEVVEELDEVDLSKKGFEIALSALEEGGSEGEEEGDKMEVDGGGNNGSR